MPWQGCVEIVTYALGFRPINDADRPLQSLFSEQVGHAAFASQIEQEALLPKP